MHLRIAYLNVLVVLGFSSLAYAKSLSPLYEKVKPIIVLIQADYGDIIDLGLELRKSDEGFGSGFLISKQGLVMTAAHVVHTAKNIEVLFQSGETSKAHVVSSVPSADLALIQLEKVPKNQKIFAKLGNSDEAKVGDQVFIIGAPLGVKNTLTVGYLSGRHEPGRLVDDFYLGEFLQTDAVVNGGNSGGPMFNMKGEVIGIVSHSFTTTGGDDGLNFAVSIKLAKKLLLENKGFWSGMDAIPIHSELADILNIPQEEGVLVQRILPGSLADKLGLKEGTTVVTIDEEKLLLGGDILLSVLGVEVKRINFERIQKQVSEIKKGTEITVSVMRKGKIQKLTMRIEN